MLLTSDSGKCLDSKRIDGFSANVLENKSNDFTGVLTVFLGNEVESVTLRCRHVFESLVEELNNRKFKNQKDLVLTSKEKVLLQQG